jgi:hypothetical protein
MAVIHNKKKFLKAAELLKLGKNSYALYRLKKGAFYYLLFILLVFAGSYFMNDGDYLSDFIFYSIILIFSNIFYYFSYKDSFLDLVYDYNETIDYYKSNKILFFEGIDYKKCNVRFTEDSVIITQ